MPEVSPEPLPFDEAIEYWRGKVPLLPEQFYDLIPTLRTRAFSVAGIARMDMIQDIQEAIGRALEEGKTLAQFKKEISDIIETQGWTGPRAWRVDNIFRTNIQNSYNTGRYKQMTDPDVAARRPYWIYSAINDARTRPSHAALDGKVFRHDDPFWDTWYPPNGFRCRCSVRTLSEGELDEFNLKVEEQDPTGKPFEPTDPETGRKLPARPLMPDEGWAHNSAKEAWDPDLGKYPSRLREQFQAEASQRRKT